MNELCSILSFSNPAVLSLVALKDFCERSATTSSKTPAASTAQKLRDLMKPFFLRREKAVVIKDLPPMHEIGVPTGMTNVQKRLYKAILEKNMSAFDESKKTRLANGIGIILDCVGAYF
jgi:SNF2 family DNA or RNA helicase